MIDRTVPAYLARLIADAARTAGIPQAEIDRALGAVPLDTADPRIRIPTATLHHLWDTAVHALQPLGGGVRVSSRWERGMLRTGDYLVSSSDTLASGFVALSANFAAVTSPESRLEVSSEDGALSIVYLGPEPSELEQIIGEFALGLVIQQARAALNRDIAPRRVLLPGRAPRHYDHLRRFFGTDAIDFGADHPQVLIDERDARAALPGSDPALHAIVTDHAATLITAARPVLGWLDKVYAEIEAIFDDGSSPDLNRVAARLAMSPRSLQRRLAEEQISWREMVERARQERATRLLRDASLTLESIAARVGYSDVRALRRAFHRWYGTSPAELRRTG
ncbi:AraC family transcriptional regulator ligand-binding domain-containing protein [Nocardia otitidiscaviarum]|uniref:AraC family transcriptional regulator n=1 Tax=Nocardia otitidiscaviarum TaxID=1823 RepID=UPI0006937B2A|nr:AraC family transcriptional regulator [Nocardia otitidiscaviarum]MBF6131627.1 AraC family transcriptional regulator ligand-binding domain-containing protein [Nocardia otitidiscaviarum]MBF6482759.1 AraC family transcriptional regulator ligand-binding domain-containing protein [Nocardia otitidiscaviarum]